MSHAATSARDLAPEKTVSVVRPRRRWLRPTLMLGGIAVVAVGSLYFWLNGGRYVEIDNAYVQAARLSVATDVSGLVATVPVHEGQEVNKGDVLLRLDDRQLRIALEAAQANLALTGLTLSATKRDYER